MRTIFTFLILVISLTVMSQNPYPKEWQTIDSLVRLRQPQSALQLINRIYDQAKASHQEEQLLKATLYRLNLEGSFMEDHYKVTIERTLQDLRWAKAPVKQILHSIVADLYWKYYQENNWRILDRTVTVNFEQNDLYTWDLRKIVSACMEHYALSLTDKDLLKNTPISSFAEILDKKEDSEKYRPTLFDFLAYRAIDLYASYEAGLTRPAITFLIDDPAYLSSHNQFAKLNIASPDSFSFEWQALKLYQEVIGIHLKDADPTALIDADLKRLSFVHQKSTLADKDSLYLNALHQLDNQFKAFSSESEIAYAIASQLTGDNHAISPYNDEEAPAIIPEAKKWDRKKAVEICQAAIDRYPGTLGAKNCLALKDMIQQPSLKITTNEAVIIGKPSLALVNYQNISRIYLRLIKMDPYSRYWEHRGTNEIQLEEYRNMTPEKSWEQQLPNDGDYRNHSAEISIPTMPAGYYVLLASTDPAFPANSGTTQAKVTANNLWVSNISYLTKQNNQFMVMHRESGKPLEGIKVQIFNRIYVKAEMKYEFEDGEVLTTDAQGMVTFPAAPVNTRPRDFYLLFKSKDDQYMPESSFWSSPVSGNETPTNVKTHFFTDRAIYRPGQTIFFKGIMVEHKGKEVRIKPNAITEVIFYDNNNQVISRQNLTTNDFGTFNGSFTAPQGVLNGTMSIRCNTGDIYINVEEYKRPKFEVSFPPVEGLYKLGQIITVKGNTITFAGSSVSGAKVHYRVVRSTNFPDPWLNWRRIRRSPQMEICSGDTITNADGTFEISFKAIPDELSKADPEVQFIYKVTADVADINGESHSSETSIPVGNKALVITTNLETEVNLEKEFHFLLSTANLNGKQEAASGTIQLFELKKPEKVLYPRKWTRPDRFTMSRRQFKKQFPAEVYSNEDDSTTWIREMVYSTPFSTPTDSIIKPNKAIEPGIYSLEIKTKDAFGEEVTYQKQFNAYATQSGNTAIASPLSLTLLTPTVEPGQEALFLIATPIKKAVVMYEVIQQEKVLSRVFLTMNKEQKLIRIPVTEEHRGNFSIQLTMVNNNHYFTQSKLITVPYTNKKLDIRFSTFRNKLLPGQEEEWQLTITGPKGEKAAAEMLASMYDASLDAFTPHNWWFTIYDSYSRAWPWNSNRCFDTRYSYQFNYEDVFFPVSYREYDHLKGFDYSDDGIMVQEESMSMSVSNANIGASDVMTSNSPQRKVEVTTVSNVEITPLKSSIKFTPPVIKANEEVSDTVISKPAAATAIQIRQNFNETAFFYPQLTTNEKGEIVIKFKAPEALTRWKFMGLAHTKDLQYGEIEKTLITQKDLMIFTNASRFMREGDHMDFSAKISNISNHELSGTAELHFFDALTMQPIDSILGLTNTTVQFTAANGGSAPVSWKISIPEGLQAITYRITATAGTFSDGEEAAIPVLSNRMLVTESMPLPVKGNQTKEFTFAKLVNSNSISSTLRSYRLSLEYTSNPAWYAVQALPYLMEFPHECAEQLFSRYYANSLASHIANSDPKIKRVFDSWKNSSPNTLKSNLEKNEELKSVLLQESPWVREAASETERRQRIALLFDLNKLASEQSAA
ncbi:MAG TPA: alpha-2-macroglobulin family protein, partial [Prolixibacteraceae bacterium]|nr:alpha-2-macroglobulin family protein [Prolixibacteraceae bacterium]